MLTTFSCTTDNDEENIIYDFEVTIAASGLDDNKLAQNNTASMTAQVSGNDENVPLVYTWSLATGNAQLSDGVNNVTNPYDAGAFIDCIGIDPGQEQINVEAKDASNTIRGVATLNFEIIASTNNSDFPRACFDQPKFFFQQGQGGHFVSNFDGSYIESLGIPGGTTSGISPDGEWLAWNPYQVEDNPPIGYSMYLVRCEGGDLRRIPTDVVEFERSVYDDFPKFSPDSRKLYFRRPNANQPEQSNSPGYFDLAVYDIDTEEVNYLTTLYPNDEQVRVYAVSPVTGEIAFVRQSYEFFPDGSYSASYQLNLLQPETGAITSSTPLSQGSYIGIDWSLDGGDLIFLVEGSFGRGIFRKSLSDGSELLPVYAVDVGTPSPALTQCFYYNNGERIAFCDYGDNNNLNIWSVDANGNDLQLTLDRSGPTFLQGVLE